MTAAVNIRISSIRIHVICNLGSLNIGKTILCRNTVQTDQGTPSASADAKASDGAGTSNGSTTSADSNTSADSCASGDPKAGGGGDGPRGCG